VGGQDEHRHDHRQVADRGPQRGGEEAVMGVERPHRERGQAHQHEVREHRTGKRHRELEEPGIRTPARRHQRHHQAREGDPEHGDHAEHDDGRADHRPGQARERARTAASQGLGEHRDHRGGERAFREQPAQQIRDPERDEEGVGDRPGSEGVGHHHVPHVTEHAAREGREADRADCTDDSSLNVLVPLR
jgi:hypothetical protein